MTEPDLPRTVAGLRLVELIGSGGEGQVWEARDQRGRRRALKLIRPDALVGTDRIAERGAWLVRIDHPALVRVDRVGVLRSAGLDGWGFVDMALVDGPSLASAPADPDALDRLRDVADALDALHAGVWSDGTPLVHRDVKPANLIDAADGLVLVDVSTLRDIGYETTMTRIGTPAFAAPEIVTGRSGPAADRYALAATAVALLTGARGQQLVAMVHDPGSVLLPAGVRAGLHPDAAFRPADCTGVLAGAADAWAPVDQAGDEGEEGDSWGAPLPASLHDDLPDAAGHPTDRTRIDPGAFDDRGDGATATDEAGHAYGWLHPDVGSAVAPAGRPWGRWVLAGAALLSLPGLAGIAEVGWLAAGLLGAGVHLAAHLMARPPRPLMALLVPPVAWAWLLADRLGGGRRTRVSYARALLVTVWVAPLGAAVVGLGAADRPPGGLTDAEALLAASAVGLGGLTLATVALAARGVIGWLSRIVGLVLWVPGAVLVAAAGLIGAVAGAIVGRWRPGALLAVSALTSVVELLRGPPGPGMMGRSEDPDDPHPHM